MSQTCKNCVGPTCKALGLPAAVPWLWQVTSELRAAAVVEVKLWHEDAAITATWIEGTTCKKKLLHCGSAPFFSHTCWKLEALLWNQKMQSIIAICRVRTGNDWTSNPKHTKQHSFQILQRHQNSETSKLQTLQTAGCS